MRHTTFLVAAAIAALSVPMSPAATLAEYLAAGPNLSVAAESLSVNKPVIAAGDSVTFTATVKNTGTEAAKNFKVRLFLDGSQIYEKTVYSLSPNYANTATKTFTVPAAAKGEMVYSVAVDDGQAVKETDEEDNRAKIALKITPPQTDLSVAAADLSTNKTAIAGGDSVYFKAIIRNTGTATAANFKVNLYLGKALIYAKTVSSLAKGASSIVAKTYTVPTDLSGSVAFRAVVDADGTVKESDEENNAAEKNLVVSLVQPDPFVTPEMLSWNRKNMKGGDLVTFRATIKNKGTAAARNVKVRLYLDGRLMKEKVVTSLTKTGSTVVSYPYTIPVDLKGDVAFKAVIDPQDAIRELDEKNNQAQTTVKIDPAQIDLAIDTLKVSPNKPKVGQQTTVTVKVANRGNTKASNVRLAVYANNKSPSPTAVFDIPSIAPNATKTRTFKWTVPAGIEPAVGYAIRAEVDPNNAVAETNEANNSKVYSFNLTAPDLKAVSGINTYTHGPIYPGVRLAQWIRVSNDNVMPVSGAKVGLYYYVGQNGANPTKLSEASLGTLPKNGQADIYLEGVLPQAYPLGTVLHVLAKADSADTVVETDETNNVFEATRTMTEKPRTVQYPYLRINVLDEDGNPKNGAVVKLTNAATGAVETKTTGVETFYNSLGSVIFESRPETPTGYSVEVQAAGYRVSSESFTYNKQIENTTERTFYLDKKALVSGRVTNQAGGALPGATVRIEGTGLEAVTDSQGRYGFLLNGGTYDFRFVKPGYARAFDAGRYVAPLSTVALDKALAPATTGYISGTVTDDSGNPLQNVDVWVNGNLVRVTGAEGKFSFSPAPGTKNLKFKKPGYTTIEFQQTVAAGEEFDFNLTMYKPSTDNHVERGSKFVSWHQHEGTPANAYFIPEYNVDVWWGIGNVKLGLDYTRSDNTTKLTKLVVTMKGDKWDCHKVEGEGDIETSAIDIPITIAAGGCSSELTQVDVRRIAIESDGMEVWSDEGNWSSASDPLNSNTKVFALPNVPVAWNGNFKVKVWFRVQKKSVVGTDGDGSGALGGYNLDKKLVTWFPQKPPTTKISTSWGQVGGYFLGILDNPVNIVAGFTDIFTVEQFNQYALEDNPVGFPD